MQLPQKGLGQDAASPLQGTEPPVAPYKPSPRKTAAFPSPTPTPGVNEAPY